jgi:hypothetical protein
MCRRCASMPISTSEKRCSPWPPICLIRPDAEAIPGVDPRADDTSCPVARLARKFFI